MASARSKSKETHRGAIFFDQIVKHKGEKRVKDWFTVQSSTNHKN